MPLPTPRNPFLPYPPPSEAKQAPAKAKPAPTEAKQAPTPTPTPTTGADPMRNLAEALKPHLEDLGLANTAAPQHAPFVIQVAEAPAIESGPTDHRALALLTAIVANKIPLYVWSGAGTGKTRLAERIATILGQPFYSDSCSRGMSRSELLGYRDANGQAVETQLSQAFTKGGVYLLDEGDADALGPLATNRITANAHATFANTLHMKHENFRFILAGNTPGTGQANGYRREPLDAAMLDRFFVYQLPADRGLEWRAAGLTGTPPGVAQTDLDPITLAGTSTNPRITPNQWGETIRAYRTAARALSIPTTLEDSGRALYMGAVLAQAGLGASHLVDGLIRKGRPVDAWASWQARAEQEGAFA